jgi:ATP-dependent DNA helicase RecQ
VTSDSLLPLLHQFWGYTSFRSLQRETIDAVMASRDSLLVLPTGGGKSLCFQAPALLRDGLAIVVSPLISLMKDQVDELNRCSIQSGALHSMLSIDSRREVGHAARAGGLRRLYVAPERFGPIR